MVLEFTLVSSEIRKGLEVSLETDQQTNCGISLFGVSPFGNANLRKGLLSSTEEVTIDQSQCKLYDTA